MNQSEAPPSPSWARDHLANERTMLAWIRTALTFMAFGVALAKLGLLLRATAAGQPALSSQLPSATESRVMGAVLILLGGMFAVAGAVKTRRWTQRIESGSSASPSARVLTTMTAGTVLASLVLVLYVLW